MRIYFLILFLLTFSISTLSQTKTLHGEWNFLTLMENGEDITLPESNENQGFKFTKNNLLFASITCNSINGKYSLGKRNSIKIIPLTITAKGCFGNESQVEQSFSSVLKKVTKYQIKDSILTLQDERGKNVVNLTKYKEIKENIQNGWKQISKCGFTFSAPKTMKDLKAKQVDSCIADFENKALQISIVSGNYGESFRKMDAMTEFKEETTKIDGKKTQLVTYISNFKDTKNKMQRNYVAGIYVSVVTAANGEDTITSLIMTITGKTKKDLETAKQIFKTIKFQN